MSMPGSPDGTIISSMTIFGACASAAGATIAVTAASRMDDTRIWLSLLSACGSFQRPLSGYRKKIIFREPEKAGKRFSLRRVHRRATSHQQQGDQHGRRQDCKAERGDLPLRQ